MLLIAHRGNCSGLNPERENTHDYIDEAIERGYDVEIDLWSWNDALWLGHDEPQYEVNGSWLDDRKDKLWIHCKNFKAMNLLVSSDLRMFFHEKESYTIINGTPSLIWAHDLSELSCKCIIPLLSMEDIVNNMQIADSESCYGICSDYVDTLRNLV